MNMKGENESTFIVLGWSHKLMIYASCTLNSCLYSLNVDSPSTIKVAFTRGSQSFASGHIQSLI